MKVFKNSNCGFFSTEISIEDIYDVLEAPHKEFLIRGAGILDLTVARSATVSIIDNTAYMIVNLDKADFQLEFSPFNELDPIWIWAQQSPTDFEITEKWGSLTPTEISLMRENGVQTFSVHEYGSEYRHYYYIPVYKEVNTQKDWVFIQTTSGSPSCSVSYIEIYDDYSDMYKHVSEFIDYEQEYCEINPYASYGAITGILLNVEYD